MQTNGFLLTFVLVSSLMFCTKAEAQSFEEITKDGQITHIGACEMERKTERKVYLCKVMLKEGKEYLIVYDENKEPQIILGRIDKVVIWVDGTKT